MNQFFLNKIDPLRGFKRDFLKLQKSRKRGDKRRAYFYWRKIFYRYNCLISPFAELSEEIDFPHPLGIVIGDGVVVEKGCTIYQNVTLGKNGSSFDCYPIIKENCIMFAGVIVAGDIVIEQGTIIGAGAVVLKDSKHENDVLVGVPAKSVKKEGSYEG